MKNISQEQKKELFPENLILLGYRGSISHNMYLPNTDPDSIDDIDLMGVYLAPVDYYVGIKKSKEVIEKVIDPWDIVSYEFKKFIFLLLKGNPNVLSLLWLKENFYIERNGIYRYGASLLESRNLFVSKEVYHSFTGYAYGQLKKMTSHTKEGYMGQKRKALVDKYGYDCKNAAHCIRLLKMGIEFLVDGELRVFREDAPYLLDIKRGKWKLEEVKDEAKRLFALADEAYVKSPLPSQPYYIQVNKLVKSILIDYINEEKEYER